MSTTTSARRSWSSALAALAAALVAGPARADVLRVPQDFDTIQAAIEAAAAGDEIVIAAGSYAESLLIDNGNDLVLRGKGKVIITGAPGVSPSLDVQESVGLQLERLRFENASGTAVLIQAASADVTLRHCRVTANAAGLEVIESEGIVLEHVIVSATGNTGFFAELTNGIVLRRCTFEDTGLYGIQILDGTGHLVEKVTVKRSGDTGILMNTSTLPVEASIIRKCTVKDSVSSGINVAGTGVLVEDNRVVEPESAGVFVTGGTCIVRDNRVIRPGSYGVRLLEDAHQVLDNRFVEPGQNGVFVSGVPSQVIVDNRVIRAGGDGMFLAAGADGCMLEGNRVVGSGNDGIVVTGDKGLFVENRVSGTDEDGFMVVGTGNVFLGNRAKGSGILDLNDSTDNGNTYVDNDFGTTSIQ